MKQRRCHGPRMRATQVKFGAVAMLLVWSSFLSACSMLGGGENKVLPKDATTLCGTDSALEAADRDMLCGGLAKLHEDTLPESWKKKSPVYRVTMLSGSQPSTMIRIEPGDQGAKLTVKRFNHGKLDIDAHVDLSEADTNRFLTLIMDNAFWGLPLTADVADMPTADEPAKPCPAGIAFLVEGATLGRYHFARAHCLPTKALEDIVTGAFGIAAAKFPALNAGIGTSLD